MQLPWPSGSRSPLREIDGQVAWLSSLLPVGYTGKIPLSL